MTQARRMGEKGFLVMICSVLMAFQPVFAAPSASVMGTVSGRGQIELNGIAVPAGTIVYSGNRIETSPRGIGYMTVAQGGRLVFGRSTSAQVADSAGSFLVRLDRGVMGAVSEPKAPIVVAAGGITIRAKQATGAFEVSLNGTSLRVLARHGSALAEAANRTVEIPEGKVMDATTAPGQSFTGKGKLLLGGLIGATVLGIGLGVGLSGQGNNCVSPSQLSCQ